MNKYVTNLTLPNGTNLLIKDSEARTNLSNEVTRATKKETLLQQNINAVESAREDGDNRLQDDINNETNRATAKETELKNLIANLNNATRINLLKPTLQTQTVNGVTCTNNGDGTYTLNGRASSTTSFAFFTTLKKGTYKFNGCPSQGSLSTYSMQVKKENQSGATYGEDNGNGFVFTVIEESQVVCSYIGIQSGYTCNSLLFKPMITDDLNATYDDFVTYDDSLVQNKNAFSGIDTSRVLATYDYYDILKYHSFDAVEDCYLVITYKFGDTEHFLQIDGVKFLLNNKDPKINGNYIIPLKEGQSFAITGEFKLTVYGVK